MEIELKTHHEHNDELSPEEETDENAKIFPQRLMEILSNPNNTDAIAWLPHGRAFIIINRQKFANTVLPAYFRKTKYTSFTRKLNRWNFTRVTRGPELGAYYHEFFQRGNEALCTQMYCKNERAKFAVSKDPNSKETKNDDTESATPKTSKPNSQTAVDTPAPNASQAPPVSPPGQVADLAQQMTLFPKQLVSAVNPTLQTRDVLLGQQSRIQDPLTQSLIDNAMRAFQSPMMMQQQSPEAALLRMQQLAAMQHQLQMQQQQQQRAPSRSVYNNYRASAA